MKRIQTFLGRRQFLITAGMASTCALAQKKLIRGFSSDAQIASAAQSNESAKTQSTHSRCPHLLSPIRVRNKILKNRIMFTHALPMRLGGPERYPTDQVRSYYSEIAKNAALVTTMEKFGDVIQGSGSPAHNMTWEDIPTVHNYREQMVEDIHSEGSLVVCGRISVDSSLEDAVTQAKEAEDKGYDAMELGERGFTGIESVRSVLKKVEAIRKATNLIIVAVMLPYTPGKSEGAPSTVWPGTPNWLENASKGMMKTDLAKAGPKGAGAGKAAPSMGPSVEGPEMEEIVEMAKMLEGLADVLRMKDRGHATNHPTSYNMEEGKPWMLPYAQAIKESGNTILTAPNGGFHDPDLNEEWIASGKTDMVAVATPLIADPQYVKKLTENKSDDIVPCVKCHDCHNRSRTVGPWFMTCAVNPLFGLSETKKKSIRPPESVKKVAVIGGGPGGMKAAITAAERGHKVTLYEKTDALGGLQKYTDLTRYKWSYKNFKDYLIRQTYKAGVEVTLGVEATPDMIRAKGYDTVLAATGAEPIIPNIPGADGKNVYDILNFLENKKSLGKKVVFIGGGLFGTESSLCLVKEGYDVTLLTSATYLVPEKYIGSHNREQQLNIVLNASNFNYELEATPTSISDGKVRYRTKDGNEKSIKCDSVVIYAGLRPKLDEAATFAGSAQQVLPLGDCTGQCGMLYKTIRSGFFMGSQV